MTEQERKATMMDLLLKHEQQKAKVACLEFRIGEYASPLTKLGSAIKSNFERVTPSQDNDNQFLVKSPVGREEQEAIELDLHRLRVLLSEYRDAVAEMEQTQACMERAGLTKFIR